MKTARGRCGREVVLDARIDVSNSSGDQVVERTEVAKEGSFRDPGSRGNLGDGWVVAAFAKEFDERLVHRALATLHPFVAAIFLFRLGVVHRLQSNPSAPVLAEHVSNGVLRMLVAMTTDVVDDFLRRCGVVHHPGPDEFWRCLRDRCGEDSATEISRVMERRARREYRPTDGDLFVVDVERLRVTLEVVAPHTQPWLGVLAGVSDVQHALDLGCGAGVASCFLALQNPTATVIGVDASPIAIRTASRLAEELDLPNVEFRVADIATCDLGRRFDLVISSAVWAETNELVHNMRSWSTLTEFPGLLTRSTPNDPLALGAACHLVDDGMYLSLERCRDLAGLAAWIGALGSVGLNFDTSISDIITINGVFVRNERLPLVAAHRRVPGISGPGLLQWRLAVADERLDESILTEYVMASGGDLTLAAGRMFDVNEDDEDFAAALLLLERRDGDSLVYFATTRGVREILASGQRGTAEGIRAFYDDLCAEIKDRPSVVGVHEATHDDMTQILPRLPVTHGGER